MKLSTLAAAFVVLAASPVFAETLGFALPGALSLEEERETFVELSDLRISDKRIDAPFGVRLESATEFTTAAPVMLDGHYVVRDLSGDEHQLHIRSVINGQMFVDLKLAGTRDGTRRVAQPGHFKVKTFKVNGTEIEVAYPQLVLNPDGTYRMGSASGKYAQQNQGLTLGGHYGEWGVAGIHDGGEQLTFEFVRGNAQIKAVMERETDEGSSVTASR